MGYRKLKFDGKEYQYVIGKIYTKVRGQIELFKNSEIGSPVVGRDTFVVTPLNVKLAIQQKHLPEFICKKHNIKTTGLDFNPFYAEIYGKKHIVMDCPECQARRADDI